MFFNVIYAKAYFLIFQVSFQKPSLQNLRGSLGSLAKVSLKKLSKCFLCSILLPFLLWMLCSGSLDELITEDLTEDLSLHCPLILVSIVHCFNCMYWQNCFILVTPLYKYLCKMRFQWSYQCKSYAGLIIFVIVEHRSGITSRAMCCPFIPIILVIDQQRFLYG